MGASHVVVWDPLNVFWEGSVINSSQAAPLRARGVCLLPCEPSLFTRSGVGGYMRRGWGAGWPLEHGHPTLFCPLTVYATPNHRRIHWMARLLPDPGVAQRARDVGLEMSGMIRLTNDSRQASNYQAAMMPGAPPIDGRQLKRCDEWGGYNVEGHAQINPVQEGHYGFALYGSMPGVRVAWAAISVIETPS